MTPKKVRKRLDQILVERKLAATRTKAQSMILAGEVNVPGKNLPKPGMLLDESAPVIVSERSRWVGRGGDKLAGALDDLGIARTPGIWLDCGAATGGFTDVLLARGADKIYAVDVGYGQIDLRLRKDPRVVVVERFNIRYADANTFPDPFGGVTLDLSFISLRLVLPAIRDLLLDGALVIALFKPQFEASAKIVGRGKGVIRSEAAREETLDAFDIWCNANGWRPKHRVKSRLLGREGNQEYFYLLATGDGERHNRVDS